MDQEYKYKIGDLLSNIYRVDKKPRFIVLDLVIVDMGHFHTSCYSLYDFDNDRYDREVITYIHNYFESVL